MAWTTARARIGWRFFAGAERRTAGALRPLQRDGWAILHDRAIPGRAGNIDHLVIGPTGIYVLDSKILADFPLDDRGGVVHVGDETVDLHGVAQRADDAWKLLFEEIAVTGAAVVPAVSVHGSHALGETHAVAHVDIVHACDLTDYLRRSRGPRLHGADVHRLATRASQRLPRAGLATARRRPGFGRRTRVARRRRDFRSSKEEASRS